MNAKFYHSQNSSTSQRMGRVEKAGFSFHNSKPNFQTNTLSSELSALVQKNVGVGEIADFRIQGRIWSAKTLFRLFSQERLVLQNLDGKNSQWQIQKRSFEPNFNSIKKENFILEKDFPNSLHKRTSIDEIIQDFFKGEPSLTEISEKKILKYLNHLFPFMKWDEDSRVFDWNWDQKSGKVYTSSSKDRKSLLLQYESKEMGMVKFLLDTDSEGKDWNLFASFESMDFYEIFLENSEDLLNQFQSVGISPSRFQVEYVSPKVLEKGRGWIA